jgi:hypothetical protein
VDREEDEDRVDREGVSEVEGGEGKDEVKDEIDREEV